MSSPDKPIDNTPRRPGHALVKMSADGVARCECKKDIELSARDLDRARRRRQSVHDALLDAHAAHVASMAEQGR